MKLRAILVALLLVCCVPVHAAPVLGNEPLLSLLPARAKAAALIRRHAIQPLTEWLFSDADMMREMRPFLERTLGLDITRVDGIAVFILDPMNKDTDAAIVLRVPSTSMNALHLPSAGDAGGTPMYRLDKGTVCARTKAGMVMGSEAGVRMAVAVDRGREPPMKADSAVGKLLSMDTTDVDIVVAAGGLPTDQTMGVEDGVFTLRKNGLAEVVVHGNATSLALARTLMTQGLEAGLAQLQQEKDKAISGNEPSKGVGALIAYYQGKRMITELTPTVEGNALKVHYQLPDLRTLVAPGPLLVGIGAAAAAIALPAAKKYAASSKIAPAKEQVQRIAQAVAEWGGQNKKLAALHSVDWTPTTNCCGAPGNQCILDSNTFTAPTWVALKYAYAGPSTFRYRVRVDAKAKRVSVEAEGDPDCDGIVTSVTSVVNFAGTSPAVGDVVVTGDQE